MPEDAPVMRTVLRVVVFVMFPCVEVNERVNWFNLIDGSGFKNGSGSRIGLKKRKL